MIVRRITAGAAGLALVGTAFAAAPAMAKSNTTTLKLDAGLVAALGPAGVTPSAVKPAKLKGTTISFPAKLKGKTITHKGGLKLASSAGFVTLQDIVINYKTGKATAAVGNPITPDPLVINNILVIKGGKNKIKKNGTWNNATASLAKEVEALGAKQDPAVLLAQVLGLPGGSIPTGQKLGKITIKVKK
ncbi:MAG: hypothetical protein H6526_00415 [Actinobacteria bacterium]|nr:hypothetical protein [Actinomycetota bacterium]MCB8998075.1 hypothetical protein [Actinomycetota bacterium]MCB9413727.1 hypothetical protein [Actinomycetota bacterium]MCB9424789.1 hypothetical protein [Actinomycetota bacterium]